MPEPATAEQVVGQRIKALRGIRGWSQQELAARMTASGYSWRQTTVTKTESAERPLRVNEAVQLSSVFGVPIGEFLAMTSAGGASDLAALISAAARRVRECERVKERADSELAEARREMERLMAAVRGAGESG